MLYSMLTLAGATTKVTSSLNRPSLMLEQLLVMILITVTVITVLINIAEWLKLVVKPHAEGQLSHANGRRFELKHGTDVD